MRSCRTLFIVTLLSGLAAGATSLAQEPAAAPAPEMPKLSVLRQNWWSYFEGPAGDVKPRTNAFLSEIDRERADLSARNQEIAAPIVLAVRDNLDAYLGLLADPEIHREKLPEPAASYSLDDLLGIAALAREARTAADAAQMEVEREQRILDGATRRRDALFKDYIDATDGVDERWLAGLRLVRARSAQAISMRRLDILQQSARNAAAYADEFNARLELARQLLAIDADVATLADLMRAEDEAAAAVEAAEERAREAQLAASNLEVETAQARSEQRLLQQRVLDADVELAKAEIALALVQARRIWTELNLDTDVELGDVEDQSLGWSELRREVRQQLQEWKRQTEDEIVAVQGIDRDDLDRNARRIIDQRVGTGQETLAHIGELYGSVADLELLMAAVDDSIADYSGTFRLWLSNTLRGIRTARLRITEFSGTTLFSVGEAPVTAGDILQGILIMLVGWALSRGIRHAIQRVGRKESIGTQASLYTISRLTHYTIIIFALFIALTSIGLDLGNLALVAGALSVGIGFGLQSIVNNFVSGVIILFERTLRVGDYIELDTGLTGTVKAINVRSTLINTNDNIDIVVPNSEFVSTRLTNWTLGDYILRVRIPFGVAYGTDKELVRKAALEACEEVPYTLKHMPGREPDVWLVEYGDSSLNFLLLVWVNRQGAKRPTRTRAAYLWALETKFRVYGIEIPFPQRDLHIRSDQRNRESPVLVAEPPTEPAAKEQKPA